MEIKQEKRAMTENRKAVRDSCACRYSRPVLYWGSVFIGSSLNRMVNCYNVNKYTFICMKKQTISIIAIFRRVIV